METTAKASTIRMSARKVRLVANAIRGKKVSDALTILSFMVVAGAKPMAKLLQSAVANAKHNHQVEAKDLYVSRVMADNAGFIKRFRPRAMGRAGEIHKHMAHVTITLSDTAPAKAKQQ